MSHEGLDIIFARRSIRKYTAEPVSDEDIHTLLEAAMAAPSASNKKPWHFIVIRDRATIDELAGHHHHGDILQRAPLCIAVCGVPDESMYWSLDCSAAAENLLLAATALGLGAVWIGMYPRPERQVWASRILTLPDGVSVLNLIAIGHPAEHKPPRTQYDEARVHGERFGRRV